MLKNDHVKIDLQNLCSTSHKKKSLSLTIVEKKLSLNLTCYLSYTYF